MELLTWSKRILILYFCCLFWPHFEWLFKVDRVPQMVEPSPHKFNCFYWWEGGDSIMAPWVFSPPLISSTKPPLLLTIFITHSWMIFGEPYYRLLDENVCNIRLIRAVSRPGARAASFGTIGHNWVWEFYDTK